MPTLIYCAARQKRFASLAMEAGFLYGARLPDKVYFAPHFIDQDYEHPDRDGYMAALAEHRPALATVLDLEYDDQLTEVLGWAEEAAQHVSEAVIIVPKAHGIIARLPRRIGGREVRLGYSLPTDYGATQVMIQEFSGWPVHALGGSPRAQLMLARYVDVHSADGNYCHHLARFGEIWTVTGRDYSLKGIPGSLYPAFLQSHKNIRAAWASLVGVSHAHGL
jgi:hypothetical protein